MAVSEEEVEDWEMSSLSELVGRGKLNERSGIDHKKGDSKSKRKMGSVSDVLKREKSMRVEMPMVDERRKKDARKRGKRGVAERLEVERSKIDDRKRRAGVVADEVEKSKANEKKPERNGVVEELKSVREVSEKEESMMMEMPIVEERRIVYSRRSKNDGRMPGKSRVVEEEGEKELTLAEMQMAAMRVVKGKKKSEKKKVKIREEVEEHVEVKKLRRVLVESGDFEVMTVEDSDFYDFDKDRVERSFKKGQVWAIYDDDDGMPRHYGLIDEVVSVNPFEVKMSWLDALNDGDERSVFWEKMGFHVSCGRFKVARKDTIKLLNIFSHLVECERAARELYRIYPKKGSIWALYNERTVEGRSISSRDERHYDIAVFLTSYSEMYGLSMAYLEKVDGYKVVFKRREVGYHAIRWLEKDDIRLFSHEIPARKLSGDEAPEISGDCWELDPASLPPDLIAMALTE